MRGDDVLGAADGAAAAVGGQDHNGGDGGFEGAVEVGEAFDVEHVDLGAWVSGWSFYGVGVGGGNASSMKSTPGTSSAMFWSM